MVKQKYMVPELQIVEIESGDVVRTSGESSGVGGGNEGEQQQSLIGGIDSVA